MAKDPRGDAFGKNAKRERTPKGDSFDTLLVFFCSPYEAAEDYNW